MLDYDAHVRSHIDYVSTVWDGCSGAGLKRLNSLQRRAAKIIHDGKNISADQKLKELQILPLTAHLKYNKGVFMYKVINRPCPSYLSGKFSVLSSSDSRRGLEFKLPHARIDLCKQSFSFSAAFFVEHLHNSHIFWVISIGFNHFFYFFFGPVFLLGGKDGTPVFQQWTMDCG